MISHRGHRRGVLLVAALLTAPLFLLAAKAHGPDILNDQVGFYNAAFKGLADGGLRPRFIDI